MEKTYSYKCGICGTPHKTRFERDMCQDLCTEELIVKSEPKIKDTRTKVKVKVRHNDGLN